mgnify:CR=1 FL=1
MDDASSGADDAWATLSRSSLRDQPVPHVPNRPLRFPRSTPPPEPSAHPSGFSIRSQRDSLGFNPQIIFGSRSYPRCREVQFRRAICILSHLTLGCQPGTNKTTQICHYCKENAHRNWGQALTGNRDRPFWNNGATTKTLWGFSQTLTGLRPKPYGASTEPIWGFNQAKRRLPKEPATGLTIAARRTIRGGPFDPPRDTYLRCSHRRNW